VFRVKTWGHLRFIGLLTGQIGWAYRRLPRRSLGAGGSSPVHLRFIGLLTGQTGWAYRRPRLYTGSAAAGPAIDATPLYRRGRLYAQGLQRIADAA